MSHKSNTFFVLYFLLITITISCKDDSQDELLTNPPDMPGLTDYQGPYLGQQAPAMIPVLFAPPLLQADEMLHWNGGPSFSNDGTEMFFAKYSIADLKSKIYYMKIENGKWTEPRTPEFASQASESAPVYSPDGTKLFYISDKQNGPHIYCVTKNAGGWSQSQPVDLNIKSWQGNLGWSLSVARDETIYFEISGDIYRSKLLNGQYTDPEKLPKEINSSSWEGYVYVEPDEKYIIFSSGKPGGQGSDDLYLSFMNEDGSWTQCVNMGSKVNGSREEGYPSVSPDGKYFFFISIKSGDKGYNPYWVDARIIKK